MSDLSDKSDICNRKGFFMPDQPGLIPPHGGYRKLRTFQCAQVVYDGPFEMDGAGDPERARQFMDAVQEVVRSVPSYVRDERPRTGPADW